MFENLSVKSEEFNKIKDKSDDIEQNDDESTSSPGEGYDDIDQKKLKNLELDDIVNLIDQIRSHPSLHRNIIKDEMSDYFKGLTEGEKQSLYIFLAGITQVTSGKISGEEGVEPRDIGAKITISKSKDDNESSPLSQKISRNNENPPITVGEVAYKEDIFKELSRINS